MAVAAVLLALLPAANIQAGPALEQLLRFGAAEPRIWTAEPAPSVGVPVTVQLPSCVFDGRTGQPTSLAAALADARTARVVYAGEKHDSAPHHRAQRELLQALLAADPTSSAAFEMLYATQQPQLDAYLSGATDGAAFQQAVDWPKTWGFPFPLYEPLFETLRGSSRRGAALNVPKRIVSKVSFSGLESLTPEERALVPTDFTRPTEPAYLAMLAETYRGHGGDPSDALRFGRFVDAMTLWNEGMAEALARWISAGPRGPVLVVAGAFHAYASGIPAGVGRRRPGTRQVSFVLLDLPDCPASLGPADLELSADYYWAP